MLCRASYDYIQLHRMPKSLWKLYVLCVCVWVNGFPYEWYTQTQCIRESVCSPTEKRIYVCFTLQCIVFTHDVRWACICRSMAHVPLRTRKFILRTIRLCYVYKGADETRPWQMIMYERRADVMLAADATAAAAHSASNCIRMRSIRFHRRCRRVRMQIMHQIRNTKCTVEPNRHTHTISQYIVNRSSSSSSGSCDLRILYTRM